MNKLETITELLVNELTDFEKNVNQLSSQIDKVESLRVKFDVSPIKGLISQLEEFGRQETEKRNRFLELFQYNLKQAKIYPKWAVITFIISLLLAFGAFFFGYYQTTQLDAAKEQSFQNGISAYQAHTNDFF
ncbi:DUF6730 family protein [Flagellimonas onchidii]|uniref:DUF6730 family protein n=1 Tax=Flagellimonas onchidii TaxID=2562684 RepID=UPI0010A5B4AF|nr:DUF6730 family protein [Allomuricauda onchidii]